MNRIGTDTCQHCTVILNGTAFSGFQYCDEHDPDTVARLHAEAKQWQDEADKYHQKLCIEIEHVKGLRAEVERLKAEPLRLECDSLLKALAEERRFAKEREEVTKETVKAIEVVAIALGTYEGSLGENVARIVRERDEALAQVAVLLKNGDNLADWVETHGCFGETQKKESGDCPLALQSWDYARRNLSPEARALLDRLELAERKLEDGQFCKEGLWYCKDAEGMAMKLQRAEAVVEAAKSWAVCCGLCGTAYSKVQEALAVWEEGKA